MAKLVLENAKGEQKKVPLGFSWSMLIFGPLVPAFRKQEAHLFFSIILIIPTYGISWITYPWFINFFWRVSLLRKGYMPADVEGTSIDDLYRRTGIELENEKSLDRDKARGLGSYSTFLALNGVPAAIWATLMFAEPDLSGLRASNPQVYLEQIRGRENYWEELKSLDPQRYAKERPAEEARRREEAKKELERYDGTNPQRYWDLRKQVDPEAYAEAMKSRRDEFFYKAARPLQEPPEVMSDRNITDWQNALSLASRDEGGALYRLLVAMAFHRTCEGADLYVGLSSALYAEMGLEEQRLKRQLHEVYGAYPDYARGVIYLGNTAQRAGERLVTHDYWTDDPCVYYDRPLVDLYQRRLKVK